MTGSVPDNVNEDLTAWFHCGRCAALFQSEAGESEGRRCAACGEDPSLGFEAEASAVAAKAQPRDPMLRMKMAEVEKPKFFKREVRRQKGRYFAMKLVLVWAAAMAVLAVSAKLIWKDDPRATGSHLSRNSDKGVLADRDFALLDKEYRKCLMTMSGFVSAGTPEEKNQFVRTPVETAGRMARYYAENPIHRINPADVRGTGSGVIHLNDGTRLIETRWTIADGRSVDAVFFQERGEWKLDWEEYVRYSEQPWALFVSGSGEGEGEFRLLARERSNGERRAIGNLKVFLHEPRFGNPGESGDPSPEFVVDPLSSDGRMLVEAFKKRSEGGRIYGSTLENRDPEGMIRVRARVRRMERPEGREFRIVEIKACHWLSIDDPGTER